MGRYLKSYGTYEEFLSVENPQGEVFHNDGAMRQVVQGNELRVDVNSLKVDQAGKTVDVRMRMSVTGQEMKFKTVLEYGNDSFEYGEGDVFLFTYTGTEYDNRTIYYRGVVFTPAVEGEPVHVDKNGQHVDYRSFVMSGGSVSYYVVRQAFMDSGEKAFFKDFGGMDSQGNSFGFGVSLEADPSARVADGVGILFIGDARVPGVTSVYPGVALVKENGFVAYNPDGDVTPALSM